MLFSGCYYCVSAVKDQLHLVVSQEKSATHLCDTELDYNQVIYSI